MPASPSVALPGPWSSSSTEEEVAARVQGEVGAGCALSTTDRVHSEVPQPVARWSGT